jgi:SAM-dependent methyltransferase
VAERFNDLDFEGLVDFYYSITSVVPPKQARQYKRGLMAGVARAQAALTAWVNYDGADDHSNSASLLEIGCGTAPLLKVASSQFAKLVGVDIAFRWLVVGKKRLHEAGLDIPLICACAEALPLRSATFERIVADSVIEHVRDQPRALAEAYRVTRPGGRFFLSTPNRFSIGPDPHMGLWAGGYLPNRWVNAYVLRMGGIPPHRQLLSKAVVSRLLQASGFVNTRVFLPYFPAGQRAHFSMLMNRLIDLYHVARRLPMSRELLYLVGPILYAVSHKGENDVG